MPKVRKGSASQHVELEAFEAHIENFEGGWTIAFESYSEDFDLSPYFGGLPNDQCQAIHMGYVIKGRVAYRSDEGEEVFEAGDAYYVAPGHTPILYAGSEVVEFSPTEELARTMEVVLANMKEAGVLPDS
jgi:hypothetical protein